MERKITAVLANELFSPFWCKPVWYGAEELSVDAPETLPEEILGLLILYDDGGYEARLRNPETARSFDFFTAESTDPLEALALVAEKAARYFHVPLRKEREYPEIFEYLGWCSWDAMEIWINEADLLKKCDEFSEKDIPVRFAILDDMWAEIEWTKKLPQFTDHSISFDVMHASKMKHYKADPEKFPEGLKDCIRKMKERAPRVNGEALAVGMWHPVTGYWAGITENGEAMSELSDNTVTLSNGRIYPDFSSEEKVYRFYRKVYDYFKDADVSFVKIDDQSCLKTQFSEICPPLDAAKSMHRGLEKAVEEVFDKTMINCMGMAYENMFSRPYSCISCASDDFQPENRSWFAKHLKQCAYNSLFQGQFHVCDWDMWWTDDNQAVKNSVLRALSGGPVYVSDRLERTRKELLEPLCLEDGRILRCDDALIPVRDALMQDPSLENKALTVFNRAGEACLFASFNVAEGGAVTGRIVPAEYGITEDAVLYEHFSNRAVRVAAGEAYEFELQSPEDFCLFTLVLLSKDGPTVLGLREKYVGVKAVSIDKAGDSLTLKTAASGYVLYYDPEGLHTVFAEKGTEVRLC